MYCLFYYWMKQIWFQISCDLDLQILAEGTKPDTFFENTDLFLKDKMS